MISMPSPSTARRCFVAPDGSTVVPVVYEPCKGRGPLGAFPANRFT